MRKHSYKFSVHNTIFSGDKKNRQHHVENKKAIYNYRKVLLFLSGILAVCIALLLTQAPIRKTAESNYYDKRIADIKKEIIAEYPVLGSGTASDFDKVNSIRDWAYKTLMYAASATENDYVTYLHAERKLRERFVDLFDVYQKSAGGGFCDGCAYFLACCYDAFGYETFSFGCAIDDIASHQMTAVRISEQNRTAWIIEDATFNLTYVDKEGAPVDIRDLYRLLIEKRANEVLYQFGGTQLRKTVFDQPPKIQVLDNIEDVQPNSMDYYPFSSQGYTGTAGRTVLLRDMRHPAAFQKAIQAQLNNKLIPLSYPPEIAYLTLFPADSFAISNSDEAHEVWAEIKELSRAFE